MPSDRPHGEKRKMTVSERTVPALTAALQEWLAKFLSVYSNVKRTVEQSVVHAPFVSTWERSRWTGKSGDELTQAQLVVYEVQKDKIKNVWRYPPQK